MSHIDPAKLLMHGLHLGHQKNKVHPRAYQYIHSYQRSTSVIDLIQTADLLEKAKTFVESLAQEGKTLLVVATKKPARQPVSEICEERGISFITNKWVGGFLTNFPEVSLNIKRMNELRHMKTDGSWNELPKHERTQLDKKLNKIASTYGGVVNLLAAPDALFIIDIKKEHNALKEAHQLGIPTIAVVDTNVNPDDVTYPIPANDDAITSITYLMNEIADSYKKPAKSAKVEEAVEVEKGAEKKAEVKKAVKKVDEEKAVKKTAAKKPATKKPAAKKTK